MMRSCRCVGEGLPTLSLSTALRSGLLVYLLLAARAKAVEAEQPAAAEHATAAAAILEAAGVQGGLIVHAGCGDGRLTAALGASQRFLVHGLDSKPENVAAARKHIQSLGSYGRISLDHYDGSQLPYIDNTVNLLVFSGPTTVSEQEVLRALCPGGVCVKDEGVRAKDENGRPASAGFDCVLRKPWPGDIDQWTHFLHDADNNAVAHDQVVATPLHAQWVGQSKWARHHNYLASMSALVSANGRIFQIVDEGPVASINQPARWFLVARDEKEMEGLRSGLKGVE